MENKKHILYIVGTPIGNLEDFTFRGVRVLSEAELILSEDTRRSVKLLNHFKIKNKLESFFEFNQKNKIEKIMDILRSKGDVAIISDAGMPLISDPGFPLVEAAIKEEFNVEVIPGASSVTASLVLSGFPANKFYFGGFFPKKNKEKEELLDKLLQLNVPSVFFESPKRISSTLKYIEETGKDFHVALCRELTKIHQEVIRGTAGEIVKKIEKRELKGEITFVLSPVEASKEIIDDKTLNKSFVKLVKEGKMSKKDVLRELVKRHKVSKRKLYQMFMK